MADGLTRCHLKSCLMRPVPRGIDTVGHRQYGGYAASARAPRRARPEADAGAIPRASGEETTLSVRRDLSLNRDVPLIGEVKCRRPAQADGDAEDRATPHTLGTRIKKDAPVYSFSHKYSVSVYNFGR